MNRGLKAGILRQDAEAGGPGEAPRAFVMAGRTELRDNADGPGSGNSCEEEGVRCPLCDGYLRAVVEMGYSECVRCGSLARFRGEELLAMRIPGFELRLEELSRRNRELLALIEEEGSRGTQRDMRRLRSMHEERQRVLSEYSFFCFFRQFVERWEER